LAQFEACWLLKVGKLDLSNEGKMGKTILFVHELYE
jgi:hypothetical protein